MSNPRTSRRIRIILPCMAVLVAAFTAACDEDRPTPVSTAPQPGSVNPNGPQKATEGGKNPISGHRTTALGKSLDVAEDLRDNKIPDYNRKIEEELKKK